MTFMGALRNIVSTPVGCDRDGIAGKTPRPTVGCDTDGLVSKTPKPTVGCDTDGIAGQSSGKFHQALQTLAAMNLFQSSYQPTVPDFGYGPGVTPGATGVWAVPPATVPGIPGGIMM